MEINFSDIYCIFYTPTKKFKSYFLLFVTLPRRQILPRNLKSSEKKEFALVEREEGEISMRHNNFCKIQVVL